MIDKYENFEHLKSLRPDAFKIKKEKCKSDFLIFTPHGGGIEPGTSELCKYVANDTHSHYLFIGIGKKCKELHITSTNFDEPILLKFLTKHKYAISIHGMANKIKKEINADIYLGGLNKDLIKITTEILKKHSFETTNNNVKPHKTLSGKNKNNVTNKCYSKEGMQIEISDNLRAKFFVGENYKKKRSRKETTKDFNTFCSAISQSITKFNSSIIN